MTTFRAHLISVVLVEGGMISSSIFELFEDALRFARETFEYNATSITSYFLALFLVSGSHIYYLALHDFLKHFPPYFQL